MTKKEKMLLLGIYASFVLGFALCGKLWLAIGLNALAWVAVLAFDRLRKIELKRDVDGELIAPETMRQTIKRSVDKMDHQMLEWTYKTTVKK